jgi:hypothetical protein
MKNEAKLSIKSAPLAKPFGLEYATRLFGAEALADLPRFKRGKNAGQIKSHLRWVRTVTGGWSPYGIAAAGCTVRAWIGEGPLSLQSTALSGMWLGRVQPLCGSACFLGEENRAAEMARLAREETERQALIVTLREQAVVG